MSARRSARLSSAAEAAKSAAAAAPRTNDHSQRLGKRKPDAAPETAPAGKAKVPGQPSKRKTKAVDTQEDADRVAMPPPATPSPNKRRRKADPAISPTNPPPLTPTPSAVGIIAAGQPPLLSGAGKRRTARPADPHATNALLRTPTGSHVLKYPVTQTAAGEASSGVSGLVNGAVSAFKDIVALSFPKSTTETLLQDACAHLCKVDERGTLKQVIAQDTCKMFTPEGLEEEINPFGSLASSICAQQVSGAAASSIRRKFIDLFDNPGPVDDLPKTYFPKPVDVAAKSIEELRSAGLSQRKAEYIKGLAEKFRDGELSAEMLCNASDDEVMEKLVAVRGLGKWSVEMFACFALKRMDIFSTGDLGVQRGLAAYMGRDVAKLKNKGGKWKYMSEQEMIEISDKFRPYRTLLMWYMWRFGDGKVQTDIKAISGD